MTSDPQPIDRGSLMHGFLFAAGVNALAIAVSVALMSMVIGIPLVAGFGLLQFAWLFLSLAGFVKAGKIESAKGVLMARQGSRPAQRGVLRESEQHEDSIAVQIKPGEAAWSALRPFGLLRW